MSFLLSQVPNWNELQRFNQKIYIFLWIILVFGDFIEFTIQIVLSAFDSFRIKYMCVAVIENSLF